MTRSLRALKGFDARSRVVYALVFASSLCALGSAFLLAGQVSIVSFVAFLNFAAGLWIAQLIHSLGHTVAGEPEPVDEPAIETVPGLFEEIVWERFLRIAVVIAAAATVFVFTASEILPPEVSVIGVGAIGAITLLAAMIGFLIAAASTLDHEDRASVARTPTMNRDNVDEETGTAEKR